MKKPSKGTDTLSQRIKELRDAYDRLNQETPDPEKSKRKPATKDKPENNNKNDYSGAFAFS